MRHSLLMPGLLFVLCPLVAAAQNLSPESRQEFQRLLGTGDTSPGLPSVQPTASPQKALTPQSAQEFRRVLGTQNAISSVARIQALSTPSTIDSTLLNELLMHEVDPLRFLILWHTIAVDVTAIDHKASLGQSPSTFHEQLGPARTSRAMGIVHLAMFEAANAFEVPLKYQSTLPSPALHPASGASRDAAIVEAAYETLVWLYPGLNDQPVNSSSPDPNNPDPCFQDKFGLALYYRCSLEKISDGDAKTAGIDFGRAIAGRIIALRSEDGADRTEPVFGSTFAPRKTDTGAADYAFKQWQIDPVSKINTALGGSWGNVKPFVLTSGFQFRPLDDQSPVRRIPGVDTSIPNFKGLPGYSAIKTWGAEPRLDNTGKNVAPGSSGDGFFVAQFWAYDGTANLCAPARLYNQIANKVLEHIQLHPGDALGGFDAKSITNVARFYALINVAMADAAISAWDAKYYFQFPRPITYIRAAERLGQAQNASPSAEWFPLGGQNSNSDQPYNYTPPFPSYPSGHAVFGGALFGTLRQFVRSDVEFQFQSDEFNGRNRDVFNYIRCSDSDKLTDRANFCKPRDLTIDCAERENADSRLFMGVHWVFDADDGIKQGNLVARQVYLNAMQPTATAPARQPFSVDGNTYKTRASLVCRNVHYPANWDNEDPSIGFGKFKVIMVE